MAEASKKVWTSGCIEVVRSWAERNLYLIAGVALGVALAQVRQTFAFFLDEANIRKYTLANNYKNITNS